jgi:hypothetical protein
MATTHTIGQTPARATVAWVRAVGILATLAWGALGARAGTLSWPVVNPNPMSNGYAAFNVLGNGKYHTGFDLTSGKRQRRRAGGRDWHRAGSADRHLRQ